MSDTRGLSVYTSGPQGSALPLTREQQLRRALVQIRELAEAWADPDVGDQIIGLIDRAFAS